MRERFSSDKEMRFDGARGNEADRQHFGRWAVLLFEFEPDEGTRCVLVNFNIFLNS